MSNPPPTSPNAATQATVNAHVGRRTTAQPVAIVAEDHADCRRGLEMILCKLGFQVITAGNGHDALDLYARHGRPDVLITDLSMPGMNGEELVETMRDIEPDVPIVAISGADDANWRLFTAQLAGAVTVLRKPFTLDDVQDAVITALSGGPL